MAVYVDQLFDTTGLAKKGWPYKQACHMYADTLTELHEMAKHIGHRREWFQDHKPEFPHYDLTAQRRQLALKYGAVSVSKLHMVEFVRVNRSKLLSTKKEENARNTGD